MPTTSAEIYRRRSALEARREAVTRLTETVARHEAKGDFKTAAVFTELLLEAQDRLRETVTHVRVGDHTPERRVVHRGGYSHPRAEWASQ